MASEAQRVAAWLRELGCPLELNGLPPLCKGNMLPLWRWLRANVCDRELCQKMKKRLHVHDLLQRVASARDEEEHELRCAQCEVQELRNKVGADNGGSCASSVCYTCLAEPRACWSLI